MIRRKTRQRDAILEAFEGAGRPLSPQEAFDDARGAAPSLGIATVYRTIRTMVEQERLVAVELPGEPSRYELAGKPHHHHFHCETCGRVFEVEGCPGDLRRLAPEGFHLARHEVVLYGTCSDCLAGARGTA